MARDIDPIVITFAGGLDTRRRPADADVNECTAGENFDLDAQQLTMRTRQPFDLVATAPNAAEIRGFAQLITRDNTITTLVQAGGNVYSWDGETTFNLVGTVNSGSKIRGPRDNIFSISDKVVITDLEKLTPVKTWDGTTFEDLDHNITGTSQLFAKYAKVAKERLLLFNIKTDADDNPHVMIGSETGTLNTLSTSTKPSSAIGPADAFFLVTPDLKPINGAEFGFGQLIMSTTEGRLFILQGNSAFDHSFEPFFEGSAIAGNEGMQNIGNDVLFGLPGRIESLTGTLNFGDVETNDLSNPITPDVEDITEWRIVYDRNRQQALCFPKGAAQLWVLHKSLLSLSQGHIQSASGQTISPWSKWTTTQSMNFEPSTVMALKEPISKKDVVYAGGSAGEIYLINGSGDQDGGTDDVTASRTSKLFKIPHTAELFNIEGWIDYRLQFATTVTITFIWGGHEFPEQSITVPLQEANFAVYNGDAWYNGEFFYSARFQTQIKRHTFNPASRGNFLQVKVEYTGEAEIEEIGLLLEAQIQSGRRA